MLMVALVSSKKATTPIRLTYNFFYLAVAMVTLDCHYSKGNLIKAVNVPQSNLVLKHPYLVTRLIPNLS